MSEFALVPYCEVDGVRNYSDSFLLDLHVRAEEEGTAGIVFMGSSILNGQSFLAAMKGKELFLYILYVNEEVAGMLWLNRFQYKWAQFHFCTFRKIWGRKTIELGKFALRKLLTMKEKDVFFFDMFVGVIPTRNRVALSYVKKCGGIVSGTLPLGVYDAATGKSEEATIITLTRGGLK